MGKVFASLTAYATACADSSAGMMPWSLASDMKASTHSVSVTVSYLTRPMSLR